MSRLTDLADELKSLAKVDNVNDGISDEDLQGYVTLALRQHDKYLTVDSLPVEEEEPVLTLAWVKVCLVRASKLSVDANLSGAAGYGRDNNTPYAKCISLSKELMTRYGSLCGTLRIDRNRVVVGTLFRRDDLYDALVPLLESASPSRIILSILGVVQSNDTEMVIKWSIDNLTDFYEVSIFSRVGSTAIFQEWNMQSDTSIPKLADGTTKLFSTLDSTMTALKITGLDLSEVNRFLVVMRNRSTKYAYSNELLVSAGSLPLELPASYYRASGEGSPEGTMVASPGYTYYDTVGDVLYVKKSGLGNTGWQPLVAL